MAGSRAIKDWEPGAFFRLNALYLVVLAVLLVGRSADFLAIHKIPDPIGGLIPIGVPWFGAFGAVMISISGVVGHNHEWDKRWNYWHAVRPIIGAIFSVVAFLIFVGLINSTGADADLSKRADAEDTLPYLVLAFVVGYREETFRSLIKRAADILLGPGIPGAMSAVVSFSTSSTDLGTLTTGTAVDVELFLANVGSADVSVNSDSSVPKGVIVEVTSGSATTGVTGLAGTVVSPNGTGQGTLAITPTAAGTLTITVTINGSFGVRTLTLHGSVS